MENTPAEFECPITRHIMTDPVTIACGHTFQKEAIEERLLSSNTCSVDNAHVAHNHLTAEDDLKHRIQTYIHNRSNNDEDFGLYGTMLCECMDAENGMLQDGITTAGENVQLDRGFMVKRYDMVTLTGDVHNITDDTTGAAERTGKETFR